MRYLKCASLMMATVLALVAVAPAGENLIADPSFETPKTADQFGLVFSQWGGWKFEGDCQFRVGTIARTGETSGHLFASGACKIRLSAPSKILSPGRYRITAHLRGLDIGSGTWNMTTEFMFDNKYVQLKKNGTFGWTPMTYVVDISKEKEVSGPSFGLFASGYLWIDDVALEKVGSDVALTPEPVLGREESPVEPPESLGGAKAVVCEDCGYRNLAAWRTCYACGGNFATGKKTASGPSVKVITSFENGTGGFSPGTQSSKHATDGTHSLQVDSGYTSLDQPQDWTGFDLLKADVYTDADSPVKLYIEVRDGATTGYWTRVNYHTLIPPGRSTVIFPTNQYVGEKSRPGRPLDRAHVSKLVFGIGENPPAPVFFDKIRLERDDAADKVMFDELIAFDFGTDTSPLMAGFTKFTPATLYSQGRGFGLIKASVWQGYNALQPEPLCQDAVCLRSGGLGIDLPNGKYHVFVNIDSPSGFWGEYQAYRDRSIIAEGRTVVTDKMDFESFKKKYYRYWNTEDLPTDNTFDKYQQTYFNEKQFDVEVTDGQLNLEFKGQGWDIFLSALVVYPVQKQAQGEAFLAFANQRRRFHFDNYFKRILPEGTGKDFAPTANDEKGRMAIFSRSYMKDVSYGDKPEPGESVSELWGAAFAGEYEPVTFSVLPLEDLGRGSVRVSDLSTGHTQIPADAINVGYVSYRLSRVAMDGSVYTIAPRLIMHQRTVEMPKDMTRRFWLTVKVPNNTTPGLYQGAVEIATAVSTVRLPVKFTVYPGTLDEADVPVGPWGHTIRTPWGLSDPESQSFSDRMTAQSLAKLREYGFTTFSGLPSLRYNGFADGKPQIDFSAGDAEMKRARDAGFTMPVITYTALAGLNLYYQDSSAMRAAGFSDYSKFVREVFSAVQKHAEVAGWLPIYWNIGDEPIGDDLTRAAENAEAYRKAFPDGPPYFTAATSYAGNDPNDPHFRFGKALHVADFNTHSEAGIGLLHQMGSDWAFYNGGNRWTYGVYMYKAVKEFEMKFRLSWHWNVVAGDPYYALDCREDDYAWCNSSPSGELIPAVKFERLREGVDDYRMLLTLARLAKASHGTRAAQTAEKLLNDRMAAFKLGQREHDDIFPHEDWHDFRKAVAEAIAALR